MEARFKKLVVQIERTSRDFEKADKLAQRKLKALAKLERQRSRARKAIDKLKTEIANAAVASIAKPAPVKLADDPKLLQKVEAALDSKRKPIEAKVKAELQAANNRLASAWNAALGPKNPIKAKGGEPSIDKVKAETEKRMKAMGFRPTKKRSESPVKSA